MDGILSIYKPVGITPLEQIKKLRNFDKKYRDVKIGYAGRLDPLAHGVMLLMIGEENKNREKYLNLNKKYEFSVLFEVQTDTYDYLGIIKDINIPFSSINLKKKIIQFIKTNTGIIDQPYPPFSSKTLNGIPLHKLARAGEIKDSMLPSKQVNIYKFNLLSIDNISSKEIYTEILNNLKKIKGDFRQKKIIKQWESFFTANSLHKFTLARFSIECSSGTYVRSLANRMGEALGSKAIAFEICRTQVEDYDIKDTLKIE